MKERKANYMNMDVDTTEFARVYQSAGPLYEFTNISIMA